MCNTAGVASETPLEIFERLMMFNFKPQDLLLVLIVVGLMWFIRDIYRSFYCSNCGGRWREYDRRGASCYRECRKCKRTQHRYSGEFMDEAETIELVKRYDKRMKRS